MGNCNFKRGTLLDHKGNEFSQTNLAYYDAADASYSRKKYGGYNIPISSTDTLPQYDRLKIIGILRRIYANNPIFAGIVNNMAMFIGCPLFKYQDGDPVENDLYERFIESKAKNICYGKRWNLQQTSDVFLKEYLITGECFFVFVDDEGEPKIQLVESELIGSPRLETNRQKGEVDGIIYDSKGTPTGYRIGKFVKGGISYEPKDSTIVSAGDVYHYYKSTRITDLRGTPPFVAALNTIVDLEDCIQARIIQIKAQSAWVATITKNDPVDWASLVSQQALSGQPFYNDAVANMMNSAAGRAGVIDVSSGELLTLATGESLDFKSPNIDSGNFDSFVKSLLVRICGVIGLPVCMVSGFSDYTYSSSRSEMLKFQSVIQFIRAGLDDFYGILSDFILNFEGVSDNPEPLLKWPEIKDIDNESSVKMKIAQIESGLSTIGMAASDYGISADQIINTRVKEAGMLYSALDKKAKELNITVSELRSLMSDRKSNQDSTQVADESQNK